MNYEEHAPTRSTPEPTLQWTSWKAPALRSWSGIVPASGADVSFEEDGYASVFGPGSGRSAKPDWLGGHRHSVRCGDHRSCAAVYVTVTDGNGMPVPDLAPDDFTVKEGGKEREIAK